MRTNQMFVLLIAIFLPVSGCFDFYQNSNVSLHENIIQYSEEEETEYESDEPNIQFDVDSNGMEQYVYVNGTVLSGAGEEDDVFIEIAFEEDVQPLQLGNMTSCRMNLWTEKTVLAMAKLSCSPSLLNR